MKIDRNDMKGLVRDDLHVVPPLCLQHHKLQSSHFSFPSRFHAHIVQSLKKIYSIKITISAGVRKSRFWVRIIVSNETFHIITIELHIQVNSFDRSIMSMLDWMKIRSCTCEVPEALREREREDFDANVWTMSGSKCRTLEIEKEGMMQWNSDTERERERMGERGER